MNLKILACMSCALLAAGVGGQEPGKTDEDKIQGTWSFVSLEKGGIDVNDDFVKEAKVTITPGKIKIMAQGKEMQVDYKLDPSKKPKHMDITANEGGKEQLLKGIYALDGDDLKVCFAAPGEKRPTEFKTQGGSSEQLVVMKRDKDAK
jgi:uncharacterized protein (TIGR03067 family)